MGTAVGVGGAVGVGVAMGTGSGVGVAGSSPPMSHAIMTIAAVAMTKQTVTSRASQWDRGVYEFRRFS